jgi:hypothetical protein
MKYFVLQDFRGYIVYYRRLVPGKQLVFKNITYVEIGWIGQKE